MSKICDVCFRDGAKYYLEGDWYCSRECFNIARDNPDLFEQAKREGIALL